MLSRARSLAVAALLVSTGTAHAMIEQVPTIDPLKTSCAGYVKRTRQNSV